MRTMLRKLAGAALAVVLLLGTAGAAEDTTLTILSVGDTHSHLDAVGPKDGNLDGTVGGLVKASSVISALRASEPNPIFLHAGDLFMGDSYFNATFGTTELQLLATLGLDAMALGNHEIWLPQSVVTGAWRSAFGGNAPFPLLCANLAPPPANPFLSSFVQPSVIKEVGGVKVGIFALVTPFDLIANGNAELLGATPVPGALVGLAATQAAQLRQSGAQVVILLSHLGIQLDRLIARYAPVHIDAIVGGHDHYSIVETVNDIPIVHAGAHYRQVGKIRLAVGASGVSLASAELVEVDQKVRRPLPSESLVAATLPPTQAYVMWVFRDILQPEIYGDFFHTQIATAAGKISNEVDLDLPKRDCGTGNLVTDALRWRTGTDVAFTVTGQTPEGIAEGPIVGEDLFRVVGLGFDGATHFGWRLATLSITGVELMRALETTIDASLNDDDYILQVSGMEYVYDSRLAKGQRVLSVTIGGAPLDPNHTYTATVNALLWAMLPQMNVTPVSGELTSDFEFSALRDYVIAAGTIDASGTNRVRDLAARGDARR